LRAAYCRENPYELLNFWLPEQEPQKLIRHEVQRQLDFVKSLGYQVNDTELFLSVPEKSIEKIRVKLRTWEIEGKDWFLLHPGAQAPTRRYPAHLFAKAVKILLKENKIAVLTGTDSDLDAIKEITGLLPQGSYRIVLNLSLEDFAALVKISPLLITNNTGPAHMACALKTPLVVLYALTNPQHFPWRCPSKTLFFDVPCKFCYKSICPQGHHFCLKKVSAEEVAQAAKEVIERKGKICTPSESMLLTMTRLPASLKTVKL